MKNITGRPLRIPCVFTLLFTIILPLRSFGAKKGPIVIGIGGGYSFFLDSGLRSYEVYHPKLIFLSEQLNLRNNWNFHVQYFPWRGFGFQLEYDHQKAGYRSDLKWYGHLTSEGEIIEVDYIEEPYKETWSLSSITASMLYALTLHPDAKLRPFVSAGIGYYFASGDEERFYHRTSLGYKKNGSLVKLSLGVKYRVTPKIGINFRGVGGTVWRRESGSGGIGYRGPYQFDYTVYMETGKIVREERVIVNSFTFLGVVLSLEYTF